MEVIFSYCYCYVIENEMIEILSLWHNNILT